MYILDKKIGTSFEELNLSDSFSFYAVGDENDPDGTGSGYDMPVVTSWDASAYDPNSFDEQTIYGEIDRAELEKYFTIPENADLRAVRKVQLQPNPAETEITQSPVFHWRNGDFTLPDNTIFTWRKLQVGTYNAEVGSLAGGVVKVKGTDTVAPGTFSFKKGTPLYAQSPGEYDVTVVFTPDDPRLPKPTETTIKINVIKNTIKDADEPDPITDKPLGTPFAELGLPENVAVNSVDGAWRWIDVAWDAASYDAESSDWQTITGTLVFDEDDENTLQQPEPAVTAAIKVKLIVPDSAPTITTGTLPDGTAGAEYSQTLIATGTEPIVWSVENGALPAGLRLNAETGEISGTPTTEETAIFTVNAANSVGSDRKELSITIVKAPAPTEFTVTFDGNGGTLSVGNMTTTNQKIASLPGASHSGSYCFDGWYTEKSGGTKVTTTTVFSANTTVYAHWRYNDDDPSSYTIKAAAGAGGSISPTGNVSVREGADQTFTITPDKGYTVSNVKIDGNSIGAVKSYTFENVSKAHTIEVIFVKDNTPQTGVFVDVAAGSYYEDAVDWATENGITKGTSHTTFSPDAACTRAQAVTFLWRAADSPEPETRTMPFTDVSADSYYYDAVLWAVENGITKGTSHTTFSPDATCTRAQAVTFLWRSEKSPAGDTVNPFTDVKSTDYYADAVLWAVREKITKGTGNTTFSPSANCARAQIVTLLWRCRK